MPCSGCRQRGQALDQALKAARERNLREAAERLKFVGRSGARDAGRAIQSMAQRLLPSRRKP